MPITYTGQSSTAVSVAYSGIPVGTGVVFTDANTGKKTPSGSDALSDGGEGNATIAFPAGLPGGDYYLVGERDGAWVAQTVKFHTPGLPPTELPP